MILDHRIYIYKYTVVSREETGGHQRAKLTFKIEPVAQSLGDGGRIAFE